MDTNIKPILENSKRGLKIFTILMQALNIGRSSRLGKIFAIITSPLRAFPDFIIIGAQRSGTTSLYNYLLQHPNIETPKRRKELHFFDLFYSKGFNWYKSYFPLKIYKFLSLLLFRKKIISGEASPYYLLYPHAPKRVHAIVPKIKILILLRNPVDRAYSHYHHEKRRKTETLEFNQAVETEEERISSEYKKILSNGNYHSKVFRNHSYLKRGIYVDQIKRWEHYFPKEQIMIIKSEDLFENPKKILNEVFQFIGVKNYELNEYKIYYQGQKPEIKPEINDYLKSYFAPYNKKLYQYLGREFNWE